MKKELPVTFFCPQSKELHRIEGPPVDDTVHYWSVPESVRPRAWVVQTVLRLREAGHDVSIKPKLPKEGVLVLLVEDEYCEHFYKQYGKKHSNLIIVAIRADIIGFRFPLADAEIVQNGYLADNKRIFHIPHWPQPGLVPRDPSRGSTIQNIAYKGHPNHVPSHIFTDRLKSFLKDRNIKILKPLKDRTKPHPWHDYRKVDLIVAARKSWYEIDPFYHKPASKLINAWHAGVPALLGPEYAYRELRCSALDYFEISSDEDVMIAIDRLTNAPDLYESMVQHGHERAKEFTPNQITKRWSEVLFKKIPRITNYPSHRIARRLPHSLRKVVNMISMPPAPYEICKMAGYLYRSILKL